MFRDPLGLKFPSFRSLSSRFRESSLHNLDSDSKPDHDDAWKFFRTTVNPRWVEEKLSHTCSRTESPEKFSDFKFSQKDFTRKLKEAFETKPSSRPKKRLAKPSVDHPTKSELIPIWGSSVEDLGMFGIGIGLHFKQILGFFWLSLIYGIILLPLSSYFTSSQYDASVPTLQGNISSQVAIITPFLEKGSAVCRSYIPIQVTVSCDSSRESCVGVSADDCDLPGKLGLFDFFGMTILFIFFVWTQHLQKKQAEEIDISQQTPQDYSIVVNDPDKDADNPDEWKDFFSQFGEVAYVTITRKNRPLLKALAERRMIMWKMKLLGYNDEKPKNELYSLLDRPKKPPFWKCAGKERLNYTLVEINQRIKELSQKDYPVCKVYVIFEHEEGQRKALETLTTGFIQSFFEMGDSAKECRFRGENVLDIKEADEPTDVIWHNLELAGAYTVLQSMLSTLFTLGIVGICYIVIVHLKSTHGARSMGLGIALINSVLPLLIKATTLIENHVNEGNLQDSLFHHLAMARITNTVLINYVTTPFSETLSPKSIMAIESILIADALVTPTIDMFDIAGMFRRRVLARFARNHAELLTHFTGSPWFLGERYTSMTKTFFLAVFYAAIYPPGLFIAAFCFLYCYWVSKYLLLRVWKKPPQYDAKLAHHATAHILLSLVCHLLVTANWYYSWPFDNTVWTGHGYAFQNKMAVDHSDPFTWYKLIYATPKPWQESTQQFLVFMYFKAILIFLGGLCLFYIGRYTLQFWTRLWKGDYEAVGEDQKIPFHQVENIQAYVPLCYPPDNELAGPLVAAHCIDLEVQHEPDLFQKNFTEQNVAEEFEGAELQKKIFGIVKGYDHERFKKEIEETEGKNDLSTILNKPSGVWTINPA